MYMGAQPFPAIFLINHTGHTLENITLRVEDYSKEVTFKKLKKGAVTSKLLTKDKINDERDIYLYHFNSIGEKIEYKILEKYNCALVRKIKVRIQSLNNDESFQLETLIDNE